MLVCSFGSCFLSHGIQSSSHSPLRRFFYHCSLLPPFLHPKHPRPFLTFFTYSVPPFQVTHHSSARAPHPPAPELSVLLYIPIVHKLIEPSRCANPEQCAMPKSFTFDSVLTNTLQAKKPWRPGAGNMATVSLPATTCSLSPSMLKAWRVRS